MKLEECKIIAVNKFKKIYYHIGLSFTLVNLTKEFLENHYSDNEGVDDIIPVLECIKEKLGVVYSDFINMDAV